MYLILRCQIIHFAYGFHIGFIFLGNRPQGFTLLNRMKLVGLLWFVSVFLCHLNLFLGRVYRLLLFRLGFDNLFWRRRRGDNSHFA